MEQERRQGMRPVEESIGRIEDRVRTLSDSLDKMEQTLEKYLTRIEFMAHFWPVRALVFGMTGLLLGGVLASILAVVLRK